MGVLTPQDWQSGLVSAGNYSWQQGFHDNVSAQNAAYGLGQFLSGVQAGPAYNYIDMMLPGFPNGQYPTEFLQNITFAAPEYDTDFVLSGNRSIKLPPSTLTHYYLLSGPFFRVRETQLYDWRVVGLGTGGSAVGIEVLITFYDGPRENVVDTNILIIPVTSNWEEVSLVLEPPEGARWAYISVMNTPGTTATFYIDEVTLVPSLSNAGAVPIGGLVWIFQHLSGSPLAPENFQLCNNSLISDERSPLWGHYTPDMVSSGLFVRAAATSGVISADSFKQHTHADTISFSDSGHNHTIPDTGSGLIGVHVTTAAGIAGASTLSTSTASASLSKTGSVGNSSTGNTETAPKNITAKPYIRIF